MPQNVKNVSSVDVPTKLKAAVVDSLVSLATDSSVLSESEVGTERWKRKRYIQGVLGVHVDDWLVVETLIFRKLCSGCGLSLSLEPGIKVDFDFAVGI